jgi:hypothetical protein
MKQLRAYRKPLDLPLHRLLKGYAGKMLSSVSPETSSEIRKSPFSKTLPLSGRLIRNGHFLDAIANGNHVLIRDFMRDYWSSAASEEFYDQLSHRYETLFLRYHSAIVRETAAAIRRTGFAFRQFVEIGSGDGKILDHFSRNLGGIASFHGVDVNRVQVENNRVRYRSNPKLTFHHCDGATWLRDHAVPGTVFATNGGVLEYFTREELESLFRQLAAECSPCVVSLTESIAADHELSSEDRTYPYGWELSLSHNYVTLLREAGFTITHVNDRLTTPEESDTTGRWLQVVAVKAG